jgi:hypothetical protein
MEIGAPQAVQFNLISFMGGSLIRDPTGHLKNQDYGITAQ